VSKARSIWLGVAVLGIATLGLSWYLQQRADEAVELRDNQTQNSPVTESDAKTASTKDVASPAAGFSLEKSSLRGTQVDGGITFDANNRVIPDIGMRRLFDYYLSLMGERDLVQIRILLKDYLSGQYGTINADIVLKYFDRYSDYLNALTDLNIGGLAKPEDRHEKVAALRKKMLGEEMAAAFFSDEEVLAALTLKRMAIANNKSLSAEEKARQLAALDVSENYSARTEADTAASVAEQTRQLDTLELTESQRMAERDALWGKEAAERLARLDQQRANWDARVEQYLLARSRIDANRGLTDAARAQAVAALRARQFNAAEQRRIASLEAIGQLKPGG
jgi:lipase chaperone LimK